MSDTLPKAYGSDWAKLKKDQQYVSLQYVILFLRNELRYPQPEIGEIFGMKRAAVANIVNRRKKQYEASRGFCFQIGYFALHDVKKMLEFAKPEVQDIINQRFSHLFRTDVVLGVLKANNREILFESVGS